MEREIVWEGVMQKYGSTVFRVCRSENYEGEKNYDYDLHFYTKEIDDWGTTYWSELYEDNGIGSNYIKYIKYYLVSVVLPIARNIGEILP